MHYLLEECRWEVAIYLCIPPYFFIFFILGRNILGRKIIELSFTVIMLWYVIKRIYGKLQQQLVKYKACWTKDSHLEAQNMSLKSKYFPCTYEESSLLQDLHSHFLAKRIFLCIENGKGQKGLNAVPSSLQYFDLLPNTVKKWLAISCGFPLEIPASLRWMLSKKGTWFGHLVQTFLQRKWNFSMGKVSKIFDYSPLVCAGTGWFW